MDYPHPKLGITDGKVDFKNAYAIGIGEWDKVTVAYSYAELPKGVSEEVSLRSILDKAFANGMRYISDSDARAPGGAHAKAHLWDNGEDASKELLNVMKVRNNSIAGFSEENIRNGEPYSILEDVFVPLYFYHRYQTEAVIKLIGGMDYEYAVKGSEQVKTMVLSEEEQLEALIAVMETLSVQNLAIPKKQLELFPPRAQGYSRSRESFKSANGVAFDALGAAATAADMTLRLLLHPERANRLIQQHALDPTNINLERVLHELHVNVFRPDASNSYKEAVGNTIQYVTLQHLFNLLANKNSIPQVKGIVNAQIDKLLKELKKRPKNTFSQQLVREIKEFREHPDRFKIIKTPKIPDGSPIGSIECYYD